ncbi:MAG: PDZ domain-containing protein [Candidatus Anammoximicrobium sp.]|nr:PDZ domain-containing protein [Candidatus Anammoximicrobium sp.]
MNCGCLLVVMGVLPLAAAPAMSAAEPASAPVAPSAAQIQHWIGQLNAERFVDREVATASLVSAGGSAVGPVLAALAESNLEVVTRAIYILQELALNGDAGVSDAAHAALEQAAELPLTPASRRARATLARLDLVRQERAIQELRQLGADIGDRQADLTFGLVEGYAVQLGAGWQGTLQDLSRLRWLRDAGAVVLDGPQVTDEWLSYVAAMHGLTMLTVKRASVSHEGLQHLTTLKELSVLNLMYVPLGDRAIETLRRLQGVGKFRIYGGRLTDAGVAKLREDLPNSDIDFRRGAFLGVGCQDAAEGCTIYTVRPSSAAEKAGLLMHDVIIEYEGRQVADYKTLTALIAANVAGDTVIVKIVRDGRTLSKRVTLGEWE